MHIVPHDREGEHGGSPPLTQGPLPQSAPPGPPLLRLCLAQNRLLVLLVMIVMSIIVMSTIDPNTTSQEVKPSPMLRHQCTPTKTLSSSKVTSSRHMRLLMMIVSLCAGRGKLASAHNNKISFKALSSTHLAVMAWAVFDGEGVCAALSPNHLRRSHHAMGDNY